MGAADAKDVVLVVDDDRVIRTLITRVLATEGYDVLEAEDGDAALDIVRAKQPDLIVLDVMMPARDGRSPASSCWNRCGARRRTGSRRPPSPSTSAGCGARSRMTPTDPAG